MVLASAAMARNLAGTIPDIDIPEDLVTAVERDRNAGVEAACRQVLAIRDSGAFDGVHLVPVSRYRQVAALLETELPLQRPSTTLATQPIYDAEFQWHRVPEPRGDVDGDPELESIGTILPGTTYKSTHHFGSATNIAASGARPVRAAEV
jgi:hypothetical protein